MTKKTILMAALIVGLFSDAMGASKINISDFKALKPYVTGTATPKRPDIECFTPDGTGFIAQSADGRRLIKYDLKSGSEVETVLDLDNTREGKLAGFESFTLSPDGSKLLLETDSRSIYRRSGTSAFYVYEIRTRILRPLSEKFDRQRAPLFSPDGRIVAFVAEDNNIYLKKIDFNTEVAVTTDGLPNAVINGVPDWVYEEEFDVTVSMAWAPDNATLCYLKYNEKDVPAYSFPLYEGSCDPMKQYALYPGTFTYKYPVAGEPNSLVTLHSYDVDNRKTKDVSVPGSYEYIPRIAYIPGGDRLLVTTLNRDQTRMEIFSVNPRANVAKSILVETPDQAWIPPTTYEDLTLAADGFVVLSCRTGRLHAYSYTYEGALRRAITSGDFDVTAYYGADAKGNHYVQTNSDGAITHSVCRVDAKGVMTRLSPEGGWASATFTPGMGMYILEHSSATSVPRFTVCSAPAGKQLRVLEENAALAKRFAGVPVRKFVTIPTPAGPVNAYIMLPEGSPQGCPVILTQYSGPGSQQVTDKWGISWMQWAAQKGYAVVCADPRGTFGKGRAWETAVYKHLGEYEAADLCAVASWIATQPWADGTRIGITGWSYGGYQTLMTLSRAGSPFAAGVAIAPVTDWRYYDTIYTERYMLTPRQNEEGYDVSAPIKAVDSMNVPVLIMHGTADDNVHFSNSLEYVSALQMAGKWCDMFIYPNKNHSIYGCDARLSVYSRLIDYFDRTL